MDGTAGPLTRDAGLPQVERITANGELAALVIRAGSKGDGAQFVTPDDATLQVGILSHRAGTDVGRHVHLPLERQVTGTAEVLIVQSGYCAVDIYDGEDLVATRELGPSDIAVLCRGGHNLRVLEDTVLVEVKQGPYLGMTEKVRY
jgi:hypothetical protein